VALVVFVLGECRADADTHGLGSSIANLKKTVEHSQNLIGFYPFLPTPLMKKQIGRSFRLIAYSAPIGDDELILFREYWLAEAASTKTF
jgi:hypothetical protein